MGGHGLPDSVPNLNGFAQNSTSGIIKLKCHHWANCQPTSKLCTEILLLYLSCSGYYVKVLESLSKYQIQLDISLINIEKDEPLNYPAHASHDQPTKHMITLERVEQSLKGSAAVSCHGEGDVGNSRCNYKHEKSLSSSSSSATSAPPFTYSADLYLVSSAFSLQRLTVCVCTFIPSSPGRMAKWELEQEFC